MFLGFFRVSLRCLRLIPGLFRVGIIVSDLITRFLAGISLELGLKNVPEGLKAGRLKRSEKAVLGLGVLGYALTTENITHFVPNTL
ncbi:hypothetical protein HanRHA438_Chr02g0088031 [Helianthus annuus]|nr:hypothetical protein HanRHA438_Chr02g0088031 [Helianthus annuus]